MIRAHQKRVGDSDFSFWMRGEPGELDHVINAVVAGNRPQVLQILIINRSDQPKLDLERGVPQVPKCPYGDFASLARNNPAEHEQPQFPGQHCIRRDRARFHGTVHHVHARRLYRWREMLSDGAGVRDNLARQGANHLLACSFTDHVLQASTQGYELLQPPHVRGASQFRCDRRKDRGCGARDHNVRSDLPNEMKPSRRGTRHTKKASGTSLKPARTEDGSRRGSNRTGSKAACEGNAQGFPRPAKSRQAALRRGVVATTRTRPSRCNAVTSSRKLCSAPRPNPESWLTKTTRTAEYAISAPTERGSRHRPRPASAAFVLIAQRLNSHCVRTVPAAVRPRDDDRCPCFLEERQAVNWMRDRLSRGRMFV